jgi:hypothetical protein
LDERLWLYYDVPTTAFDRADNDPYAYLQVQWTDMMYEPFRLSEIPESIRGLS